MSRLKGTACGMEFRPVSKQHCDRAEAGTQAWVLSFSCSRAIQDPVLEAWRGQAANVPAAQDAFARRARLNGLARMGRYQTEATG